MATTADEHIIKIVQQVIGGAEAGQALRAVEERIAAEEKALAGLQGKAAEAQAKLAEMMEGAGKGSVSLAAIDKQRAAVAALEKQAEESKATIAGLGQAKPQAAALDAEAAASKRVREQVQAVAAAKEKAAARFRQSDASAQRMAKESAAAQKAAGAESAAASAQAAEGMGGLVAKMQGLSKLGTAGVVLAVAAALLALAVAAAAATLAVIRYGLASADAARSARLLDNAAAGSVARGSELNKIVGDIAASVPIAREQVAQFGRALQLAGINGLRLQTALTTIAMIESVVPGAGAKVQGLVERFQKLRRAVLTSADLEGTGLALVDVAAQLAKGMGITTAAALAMLQNGTAGTDKVLDAMRKAVEQKFGKTIAAQAASLSVQWAKLKENMAALFSGLDMEPVLAGLKSITDLFSQQTVTGKALKLVLSGMFQGLLDAAAVVLPLVRAALLSMVIVALRAYIAFKPIGKAISEAFGNVDGVKAIEYAMIAGKVAAYALVFVFGALATVVALALAPIIAIGSLIYGAMKLGALAAQGLVAAFGSVGGSLSSLASVGAGAASGLVDGFVQGITGKIGAAVASVAGLGAAVEGALRNAIGWHSPATLGVDAAVAVGEGFEVGAEKAEPAATAGAAGMIDAKSVKGAAKGAKGTSKIVYIEHFHGTREALTELRAFLGGEFEFQGAT